MIVIKKAKLLAGVALAILSIAGCGGDTTSSQVNSNAPQPHTIASVKDAVWPEGKPQDASMMDANPARENIIVVLDMSGSMAKNNCSGRFPSKSLAAKSAMRNWIHSVDDEANLGLVIFDSRGPNVHVPLGMDNRDKFAKAVNAARPAGGTPLKTSISLASNALEQRAVYQQGYGKYQILVVTDGEHNPGEDPGSALKVIFDNPANPIEITTIGFCIENSALNQPGLTRYQSAKNPEELIKGLESVLAESEDFQPIQEFEDDA